jgi:hypothetical protein
VSPQWRDDDSVGIDESIGSPRRRRSSWARIAVLAAIALVLGTGLGLGGSWLIGRFGSGRADPAQRPIPTFTGALPTATLAVDPSLAPQIIAVTKVGDTYRLTWTDPSGGAARFVVVRVDVSPPRTLGEVAAGETETIVANLDPPAARYCFHILAITDRAYGISEPRCTDSG